MLKKFKKYNIPFRMTIQTAFQYRVNLLFMMLFSLLPLLAILSLWNTLYKSHEIIGGFTLENMITYVIVAKLIEITLLPEMHWSIQDEVSSGTISKYLIKPISYLGYWFMNNLGAKIVNILVAFVPITLITLLNYKLFIWIKIENVFPFFIAILISMIIYYLIYYTISLFSLFFVEISSFFFTFEIVLELLSGVLIPLELLPSPWNMLVHYMPFYYMVNFPVDIYLGKLDISEIWLGIIVQISWCLLIYIFSCIVWRYGLNKYESVGA